MANIQQVSMTAPTEYGAEAERIARNRRMAEMLQQQATQPLEAGTMAGGYYIPTSPLAHLAQALKGYSGMAGQRKADTDAKALGEQRRADTGADMQSLVRALRGTPASSETIVDEQANEGMGQQAQINAPAVSPMDSLQAALPNFRTPEMQQAGFGVIQQQIAQQMKPPEKVDGGDKWLMVKDGVIVGTLPKNATPDARLKEEGSDRRHATPSGSAILGEQGQMQRHIAPSGSAILTDERTRAEGAANRGVTVRGQDLVDTRTREQMDRDKFGTPMEVTGPNGPMLVMQNKGNGQMVDANTRQPIGPIGPKLGESAQKQQTGVENTQGAIREYRDALKSFSLPDLANPAARARMGTVYNNMLLQAKEAYNLGVLNGPDYKILQEVITSPASMTGAMTTKKALDDQAKKLDEIMGKIGGTVSQVQSGQTPKRRATDDPLGLRK